MVYLIGTNYLKKSLNNIYTILVWRVGRIVLLKTFGPLILEVTTDDLFLRMHRFSSVFQLCRSVPNLLSTVLRRLMADAMGGGRGWIQLRLHKLRLDFILGLFLLLVAYW